MTSWEAVCRSQGQLICRKSNSFVYICGIAKKQVMGHVFWLSHAVILRIHISCLCSLNEQGNPSAIIIKKISTNRILLLQENQILALSFLVKSSLNQGIFCNFSLNSSVYKKGIHLLTRSVFYGTCFSELQTSRFYMQFLVSNCYVINGLGGYYAYDE